MSRLLLLTLLIAAPTRAQDYAALVVSQGAFGAQNSSVVQVDAFDDGAPAVSPFATGRIYTQGAEIIGERLYLTAGDSFSGTSRVDVLDAQTGEVVGQATDGLVNPRYIALVGPQKAYVTNQDYTGEAPSFVTPLDLATNTAGTPIEVEGTPEDVTVAGAYAFVALGAFGGRDSLAVIDPATDALVGYVDIGCAARFVVGSEGPAWAICTDTDEAVAVDATSLEVVQRVAFGVEIGDPNGIGQDANSFSEFATRTAGGTHSGQYVLISSEDGLIVLDGQTGAYETIPIADADTRPITAVGGLNDFFGFVLGRADADNPFSANGTVTVHDRDGELLETLPAGVFPSYVAVNPLRFYASTEADIARGLRLTLAGAHPVRQRTALALALDRAADVRVELFDLLGRPVATLAAGARAAGEHRVDVDASVLPAGVYLVRATAGGRTATLPLTVVR